MKNTTVNANKHDEANDEWVTPKYILDALGDFELDPCASVTQPWTTAKEMLTKDDDGLKADWAGKRVWLNPPYGRAVTVWMKRMAENGNGIALPAARVGTSWFRKYVFDKANGILFLDGRLVFHKPNGDQAYIINGKGKKIITAAGFPSCLVAYSKNDSLILQKAVKDKKLKGFFVKL